MAPQRQSLKLASNPRASPAPTHRRRRRHSRFRRRHPSRRRRRRPHWRPSSASPPKRKVGSEGARSGCSQQVPPAWWASPPGERVSGRGSLASPPTWWASVAHLSDASAAYLTATSAPQAPPERRHHHDSSLPSHPPCRPSRCHHRSASCCCPYPSPAPPAAP